MTLKCISNKTGNENLIIGNLYNCFSDLNDDKIVWVVIQESNLYFVRIMAYREDFINKRDWREAQLDKLF